MGAKRTSVLPAGGGKFLNCGSSDTWYRYRQRMLPSPSLSGGWGVTSRGMAAGQAGDDLTVVSTSLIRVRLTRETSSNATSELSQAEAQTQRESGGPSLGWRGSHCHYLPWLTHPRR